MKKKVLIIFFAVAVSVWFAGCATLTIQPEQLGTIQRIGVISLVGNELCTRYVGTTVFTSKRAVSDVTDWNLDENIQQIIKEAITSDSQFTYVDLNIDSNTVMKIYGSEKAGCTKVGDDINYIKEEIADIKVRYGVDTIILVVESWATSDYITGRSGLLYGYGLHQSSFLGITDTITHIFARVIVVDTNNFETLAEGLIHKYEEVDNEYWNLDFKKIPLEKRQFIERSIKRQVQTELIRILKKMHLIREAG